MIRCAAGGYHRGGDASDGGRGQRKGCRAASVRTGARTRRGGMRWRVRGAARVVAQRDALPGLRWRKACTGGRPARRCRSLSTMAARRTCARDTPSPGSLTGTPPTRTALTHTTPTPTSMRTHTTCRTRSTRLVRFTVLSDSQHLNIALLILR